MRNTFTYISLAAAIMVAACFTACEKVEVSTGDEVPEEIVTPAITMSVNATKVGETKALSDDGSAITSTWTQDDEVEVWTSDGTTTKYGTITAQNSGPSTRLSGTLDSTPSDGESLLLKYLSPNYSTQDGTLTGSATSIDKVCDYATATVTATVADGSVTTNDATFTSQQAILKLNLNDGSVDITSDVRQLTVTLGGQTVTVDRTPAAGPVYVAVPAASGSIVFYAAKGKYLYTKSVSKTLTAGHLYPVNLSMSIVEGALSGLFSVSASKKVYFSKGNLRAYFATAGTSHTWDFADKQFNAIGNDAANNAINGDGSVSTGGKWVDLFGWSTASTTYGINNSTTASDYSGDFRDWGTNAITNGGNMASIWRTLGNDEWKYLFVTRASGSTVNGTSDARYTHAAIIVNVGTSGAKGIILFPDGVTIDGSEADSWGTINGNSNWDTKCSIGQWEALEAKGCVFLPAAGYRTGTDASSTFGYFGKYWSSTPTNDDYAYSISFESNQLGVYNHTDYRHFGISVRLVRNAN